MLQAQIEIVDEAGLTEESVTILGSGRVALGQRESGGYLHAQEAAPDLAVIVQDGDRVSINVKVANALQREGEVIAAGSFELDPSRLLTAFIQQIRRHVRVKQLIVDGELWGSSTVIHTMSSSLSLVRRAQASAARGAIEVSQQLERLRAQGKIDARDNLVVPFPADMKIDSKTDL